MKAKHDLRWACLWLALGFASVESPWCGAQPGALDTNFNPRLHFRPELFEQATVTAMAAQPDGKILVGGGFDQVNDVSRLNIARLNEDGTLDLTFDPSTNVPDVPCQILVQRDGKILVNVGRAILRLRADGTADAFGPRVYAGGQSPGQVVAMALTPDGKIVIGGAFTTITAFYHRTNHFMARLHPNGILDLTFQPALDYDPISSGSVLDFAIQADGKIVATGYAYATNGSSRVSRLFRLLPSGAMDNSFGVNINRSLLGRGIAVQLDGKILVGGLDNLLLRLHDDGSVDSDFHPAVPLPFSIYRGGIQPQSNGKVLLGYPLMRLKPDGSRDSTFTPNINGIACAVGIGAGGVCNLAVLPDGKIVIGGYFNAVNGADRTGLARLLGAAPCRFQSITRLASGEVQMTLTGETYQPYALQASSDLAQWVVLATNSSPSGVFSFSDSTPSNSAQRFYRAVFLP